MKVDLETIPVPHHDLMEVFSKRKATISAPHWLYNLAIDLFPGAVLSHGHLYSLSMKEQQVMEDYISEGLCQGPIWPSSSL